MYKRRKDERMYRKLFVWWIKKKMPEEGKISKKQAGDGLCRAQSQADFLSEAEFILKDELQIRTLL